MPKKCRKNAENAEKMPKKCRKTENSGGSPRKKICVCVGGSKKTFNF
jgi:hypothetical protein